MEFRPFSRLNLLGIAAGTAIASSMALAPFEASAKWVRVTVRATMDAGSELYTNVSPYNQITQPFYPSFIIRDYSSSAFDSTTASWTQDENSWSYYPLFDFGTLTNTAGFYGSHYNARNTLTSAPDEITFNFRDTSTPQFVLNTGRADNATGYTVYNANNGVPKAFTSISLAGNINNFDATSSNQTVGGFIQAALGTNSSGTFACAVPNTCAGEITAEENQLQLTWDQVTFEMIEPVPAPLPLAGGAAAFGWARKLKRRSSTNANLMGSRKA
jgi:hypothetical protein